MFLLRTFRGEVGVGTSEKNSDMVQIASKKQLGSIPIQLLALRLNIEEERAL